MTVLFWYKRKHCVPENKREKVSLGNKQTVIRVRVFLLNPKLCLGCGGIPLQKLVIITHCNAKPREYVWEDITGGVEVREMLQDSWQMLCQPIRESRNIGVVRDPCRSIVTWK